MNKTILLLAIFALFGCATTPVYLDPSSTRTSETVDHTDFSELEISNDYSVELSKGAENEYEITVEAPDNLHEYIEVKKQLSSLVIKNRDYHYFNMGSNVKIKITLPAFSSISLQNDVKVEAKTPFILQNDLDLSLQNDAEFKGDISMQNLNASVQNDAILELKSLNAQDLTLDAQNDSKIELEGTATEITVDAQNDANVKLDSLVGTSADLTAQNSAKIEINVTGTINIVAENSAHIIIHGGTIGNKDADDDVNIETRN